MRRTQTYLFILPFVFLVTFVISCGRGKSATAAPAEKYNGVVFNELAGTGQDYVEFANTTDTDVDFSGLAFADSEANGAPKYASALRFPSGTVIAAQSYLTVFLESDCPDAGTTPCFRGESGISQNNGETVFLLDSKNEILLKQAYPANAASSSQSFARLPNKEGEFAAARRTPGAFNEE